MTLGLDDTFRAAHLRDMASRCSPVYRVFGALDAAPLDAETRAAVGRSLSAIADFAVWQELTVDPTALDASLEAVLRGDPLPAPEFAAAWHGALEASLPDRRSGNLVLRGFVGWMREAPPCLRPLLAGDLRVLFTHAAGLGEAGLRHVLSQLASVGPDGSEAAAGFVKAYAETDAEHVKATAALAAVALRGALPEALERLAAGVTLEAMMESQDACRILPALARACHAAESAAPGAGLHLVETVSRLAGPNTSPAYGLVRKMPRILARLPGPSAAAYLAGMDRLLQAAGPRLIGYVLDRLPAAYRKDAEEADARVDDAVSLALHGGTTAADWFLERRTSASTDSSALVER